MKGVVSSPKNIKLFFWILQNKDEKLFMMLDVRIIFSNPTKIRAFELFIFLTEIYN